MFDIVVHGKPEEVARAKEILDFLLNDPSYYKTWLLGVWDWHDNARSFSGLRTEAEGVLEIWRKMTGLRFL